nr:MAG TPA: hypothetical protein [Caudoviricetes sp.]
MINCIIASKIKFVNYKHNIFYKKYNIFSKNIHFFIFFIKKVVKSVDKVIFG